MHPFRTDSRARRTIYQMVGAEPSDADQDVGRMDTPELAAFAVAAMNAALALAATVPAAPPPEVVEQLAPKPIEPVEPVEPVAKKQCPKCQRLIAVRLGGQYLAPHNDEERGGKPCDGRVERPASPPKQRRIRRKIPDNLIELLAKHDGSAAGVAHELGLPPRVVQNWKTRALEQAANRERLAALPLVDRTDDRSERSGAA